MIEFLILAALIYNVMLPDEFAEAKRISQLLAFIAAFYYFFLEF